MRKHISLLTFVLAASMMWAASVTAPADIPTYYANANGKSGTSLYNALNTITNVGFKSLGYDGAIDAYQKSDVYPTDPTHPDYIAEKAGQLWDMYGGCSFTSGNECGNYNSECDCYNREHSVPKSWWGGNKNNMYSDIFHLVPTDGYVNNRRSSYAFGEVQSTTYTYNGCKLGSSKSTITTDRSTLLGTEATCSGTVFEPRDEYKGDFARGYLGMIAKYSNESYSITSGEGSKIFEAFSSTTHFGLTKYGIVLLMKWHREDPVSRKEIDRNNGIQQTQGNRNPFIDYPYLAEYIWGEHAGETVDMSTLLPSTDPAFIPGVSDGQRNTTDPAIVSPKGTVDLGATNTTVSKTYDANVKGINLTDGNLTLSLSGSNYFSLATTTVTKAQAEAGYNVTITYAPTTEGSHTATLTINGCGVTDHQVTLTGSCTAVHTVTWVDAQQTQVTTAATGQVPALPANTPANCSETRVFRGWTATPNYTGEGAPDDLFTKSTATVSGPVTYYAVYADKQGDSGDEGSVNSVVMEDYAAISGKFGDFMFAANKNTGTSDPAYNAGGKDGRLYAKNSLTISSEQAMTQIVFNISTQGRKRLAPITASEGTIAAQVQGDTIVSWTGSATSVTFTVGDKADYGSENTKAGQLDFTSVEITIGTGTSATYSNFSLQCSSEPVVEPDYTVTFYNNGSVYATRVGHAGVTMEPVADPAAPCQLYTFKGWSTHQYPGDNIEYPVLDYTTLIPEANIAYYAVFSCMTEQEASLPEDAYIKISSTESLMDGNYLVVGQNESLFAMSATFTGYYLRHTPVVDNGNVIYSPADSIIWYIDVDKDNGTLTFRNAAAGYLYIEKSENGTKTYYNIKLGNNTTDNKFTYSIDAQTGGWIFTSVSYPERQLEYYASKSYWSNYIKQDAPVSLYLQNQAAPVDIVIYTTVPSCQTTAIEPMPVMESDTRKVMMNGQLFIIRDGKMYNLQGARVK